MKKVKELYRAYKLGFKYLNDEYFIAVKKQTIIEFNKKPKRSVIINKLLELTDKLNYLEIGVRDPKKNFDKIICKNKYSVDPGVEFSLNPVDFKMTSDDFFESLNKGEIHELSNVKFDLIFIDGLHLADQVQHDIQNSLKYLSEKGFIVLHDCNPPTEFHQRECYSFVNSPAGSFWNGTTWKAFYKFRHHKELYSICFDTDWGVGVLSKMKYPMFNSIHSVLENPFFEFKKFDQNRAVYLNLKNYEEWIKNLN